MRFASIKKEITLKLFLSLHYLYWQSGLRQVDFQTKSMENRKQAQALAQSSNSLQNLPTKSRVKAFVFERNQNPACPPSWKRTRQRMRCDCGLIKSFQNMHCGPTFSLLHFSLKLNSLYPVKDFFEFYCLGRQNRRRN